MAADVVNHTRVTIHVYCTVCVRDIPHMNRVIIWPTNIERKKYFCRQGFVATYYSMIKPSKFTQNSISSDSRQLTRNGPTFHKKTDTKPYIMTPL